MLYITIPKAEGFNERLNMFYESDETKLVLEHSLISISKWEAKWQKPYLVDEKRTPEEVIDYIRCMTLNPKVDPNVYYMLSAQNHRQITDYISSPMTATTFRELPGATRKSHKIITSEYIYYLMIAYGIPFECQKWHINRLLTLIRICDIKNQPNKKMSKSEIFANNTALNKARRSAMNSKG